MKKPKKSMIILISILAVIGIAVGGCSMHQYQKKTRNDCHCDQR